METKWAWDERKYRDEQMRDGLLGRFYGVQRTKPSTRKPSGILQPLPIPGRPWHSIGMDFLATLPVSIDGHDMIIVIDRLCCTDVCVGVRMDLRFYYVADA